MMKLVILPGWQHSSREWQDVADELNNRGISTKVIDLPGFGEEPFDNKIKSIDDLVTWFEDKAKSLNLENFVLCGHSYGGRIAAKFTLKNKPLVKGLVLIGSPNLYRPNLQTKSKKCLSFFLSPLKSLLPERIKKYFRSEDYQLVKGTELEELFQSIISDDQTNILNLIDTKTYLLWGELDNAAPLHVGEAINQLMPNSKLDILTQIGHNIHLEKPKLLAAKLVKYVKAF